VSRFTCAVILKWSPGTNVTELFNRTVIPAMLERARERYFAHPVRDLMGGLMAAIVALPLCLAFGVASGLGAAAGLYGAIACGIFAAIFGGTPAQCSGPTGPMTVVAASIISAYPNHPELVFAAVMTAGAIQIVMGLLKGGDLIQYMPYPVISGFMTGIGAIIVCIQLAPLFGLPGSSSVISSLQNLPDIVHHYNNSAMLLSGGALAIIYILPRLSKRLPASLVALIVTTWLSQTLHMDVPRIGEIPSGFPLPHLPTVHAADFHLILQSGLTLAVLGAIDSLLTSLVMDKVTGTRHDSNQELIGQGIGNLAAGLIRGLPGAGATMRSMVNVKSGGTTYLSGAIHGALLLAILLGLGRIAAMIPLATLAAILLTVGISIMDWRVLRRITKIPKADSFVMVVVLLLTIFVDLIVAVLSGVALASVIFVKKLSDAGISSLSRLDESMESQRLGERISPAIRESIYTYRFNGPLFFGEAKNLTDVVETLSGAKYIVLVFYNVPLIDQTGAYALEHAVEKWQARGVKVLFVGMQDDLHQTLLSTGALHKFDDNLFFDTFESAIKHIAFVEDKRPELEIDQRADG
jgi:sulfate permease, SulP family